MEQQYEHPSFGNLQLTRRSSGRGKPLFGSGALHTSTVVLKINTAYYTRKLSNDWIYPHQTLIEVEMGEAQFAQFIMSSGMGEGTPCTLNYILGKEVEPCPQIGMREQFHNEIDAALKQLQTDTDDLKQVVQQLSTKPRLTKEDKDLLNRAVDKVRRTVASGLTFIQVQFDEAMDKSVNAAKMEAEAYAATIRNQAGMVAIQKLLGESHE